MLILDKPYVSELLQETARINSYPVLLNRAVSELKLDFQLNYWNSNKAINSLKKILQPKIYCNSENSINWITENLNFTNIPEKIELFKNKVKFREITQEIYPELFFKEVEYQRLTELDVSQIKFPFVIKPSVGFLSIGVYKIHNKKDWADFLGSIDHDLSKYKDLFPVEVMNSSKFIIEEMIKGEEYAVDVYFDSIGSPHILNILKHPFVSDDDVSDRIYYTSYEVVTRHYNEIKESIAKIGKVTNLINFPFHIELRLFNGNIVPIEVNPMRFAGWCTTDIAYFAYGINVYEHYFNDTEPDWDRIFDKSVDNIYYLAIAEVPDGLDKTNIGGVDYANFMKFFEEPLEVRKYNPQTNPIFAVVFAKSKNFSEPQQFLEANFQKFINLK